MAPGLVRARHKHRGHLVAGVCGEAVPHDSGRCQIHGPLHLGRGGVDEAARVHRRDANHVRPLPQRPPQPQGGAHGHPLLRVQLHLELLRGPVCAEADHRVLLSTHGQRAALYFRFYVARQQTLLDHGLHLFVLHALPCQLCSLLLLLVLIQLPLFWIGLLVHVQLFQVHAAGSIPVLQLFQSLPSLLRLVLVLSLGDVLEPRT
mmetsp:Transcript_41286/g.77349  ORF Transcript_41286/g.77349 Transcript_41286/m.77349 type:complete len:204 (+) Transcript_41286:65-676(+)